MKVSVVSPVYRAEKIIDELVKRLVNVLESVDVDYEILLVDDRGGDNSWEKIQENHTKNNKVKGVQLSRNFGQHAAIKAGLTCCNGDVCIVIDCDLQDDPSYISELLDEHKKGFDIVYTYKDKRKHSFVKNITAEVFNKVFNYLTDNASVSSHSNVGSYSLISNKVKDEFIKYPDYEYHYLMVLRWIGFESSYVKIRHHERYEGKSSYTLKKLINHAMVAIIYQSDKLLKLSIRMGMVISSVAFILMTYIVFEYFSVGFKSGWASIFVLILFSLGMILISIGVLGLYLGKVFDQTKNRPQFIIQQKN